jgi:hypothetical protein
MFLTNMFLKCHPCEGCVVLTEMTIKPVGTGGDFHPWVYEYSPVKLQVGYEF